MSIRRCSIFSNFCMHAHCRGMGTFKICIALHTAFSRSYYVPPYIGYWQYILFFFYIGTIFHFFLDQQYIPLFLDQQYIYRYFQISNTPLFLISCNTFFWIFGLLIYITFHTLVVTFFHTSIYCYFQCTKYIPFFSRFSVYTTFLNQQYVLLFFFFVSMYSMTIWPARIYCIPH